jgi:hypothetical protein
MLQIHEITEKLKNAEPVPIIGHKKNEITYGEVIDNQCKDYMH